MKTTTIGIAGMTCENCVRHATQALLGVPGVERATVDLATGTAEIATTGEPPREAIAAALADEGYDLS